MKKIHAFWLGFITIVVALVVLQYLYTVLLFPKNFRHRSQTQLNTTLEESNNSLSYLVLWDSIAQNAIHPWYLSGDAFNYAFQWENILTTQLKLQSLYDRWVSIEYVVVELWLWRFNTWWVDNKLHGDNLFFLHHMLEVPIDTIIREYDSPVWIALETFFPVLWSGRMRWYLLQSTKLDMYQWWIGHDGVWDGTTSVITSEKEDQLLLITSLAQENLKRIFGLIEGNNSHLILMIYPSGKKWIWNTDPRRSEYIDIVEWLAAEHIKKEKYTVVDYYDLFDECISCFIDGGYANTSGAILITQKLSQEVLNR